MKQKDHDIHDPDPTNDCSEIAFDVECSLEGTCERKTVA